MIYFVQVRADVIHLLDIYAKGAKENLTDADKASIRRLIAAIEADA